MGRLAKCPDIPFFGSNIPDARCVDGILYDLRNRNSKGVLMAPVEEIPCPICRTREFIEYDPLDMVNKFSDQLAREVTCSDYDGFEERATRLAEKWYLNKIKQLRVTYDRFHK